MWKNQDFQKHCHFQKIFPNICHDLDKHLPNFCKASGNSGGKPRTSTLREKKHE